MKAKLTVMQLWLLAALSLQTLTTEAQPVVTKIAAGGGRNIDGLLQGGHSLFIKSDGSLWGMGQNSWGQLGDGTTNSVYRPEMIEPGGVTAIAAGYYHSLFIMNGNLWAMGNNQYGQLGDGTTTDRHVPELITNGVTAISAGAWHSLFIRKHGLGAFSTTELWAMGQNTWGQLGDGTANNRASPVRIEAWAAEGGGFLVTNIAAGGYHSMLIRNDGSLWAWGLNNFGQLGDGSYNTAYAPEQIIGNTGTAIFSGIVTAIAAGSYHSMFLGGLPQGSTNLSVLYTMGDNSHGQLGADNYYTTNNPNIPIYIQDHVSAIAAGGFNSFFLTAYGPGGNGSTTSQAGAMGDNTFGQTGLFVNDPNSISWIYFSEPDRSWNNIRAIAAGSGHTLLLDGSGALWGLGDNVSGQLGSANYTVISGFPQLIPTLPPPQIDIVTYSNQPVLVFTPSATNYVLQMTTNLSSGVWVPASGYVPINAWQFTNAPANAFFRFH